MAVPYNLSAPVYDLLSGERLVYRAGRLAAVDALWLSAGQTVLDVGCGTGLSLPLLAQAVGVDGHVIGLDGAAGMLHQAEQAAEQLPARVTLLQADATDVRAPAWATVEQLRPTAVLFGYALSIMRPWQAAWEATMRHTPDGTRVVVLDMALPEGRARALTPLARLACRLGGADIHARPWRALEQEADDVSHQRLRGGHVRVVAGVPSRGSPPR